MNQHAARWCMGTIALVGVAAFGFVDANFDANNPWFFLGLTLLLVCGLAANAVLNASRANRLNDEFETGYRVGYRAGRRASLSVVRPPGVVRPIPLRRKQKTNEPTWPDTEDFPPGSTKLQ